MNESERTLMTENESDWTKDPRWGKDFITGGNRALLDTIVDRRIDEIEGPEDKLPGQVFRYARDFQRLMDAYGEAWCAPTLYVAKLNLSNAGGDFLTHAAQGRLAAQEHPWKAAKAEAPPEVDPATVDWTQDPRWGPSGTDEFASGTLEDLVTGVERRLKAITAREPGPVLYGQIFRWSREAHRLAALWKIPHNTDELDDWLGNAGFEIYGRLTQLLVDERYRRLHPDNEWVEYLEEKETFGDDDAWTRVYMDNFNAGMHAAQAHPYKLKSAFHTLDTLMDDDDGTPSWLIEDAWPEGGKIVLSSPAKSGKTTFIGNVCRSLLDGDPLLNQFLLKPLADDETILIFDTEMTKMQLHRWYEEQGFSPAARSRVRFKLLRGKRWDPRKKDTKLIDQINAENVKVVIIDPIGPILRRLNLNQDRDPDVGPVLAAFEDLMVETDLRGLLVSHHHGHNAERAMGAQVFRAWPDVEWILTRKESSRFIKMDGRDVELPESLLGYDAATRRLSVEGGDRKSIASAEDVTRLVTAVKDSPGIGTRELRAALSSMRNPEVDAAKLRAVTEGRICVHNGRGNSRLHYPATRCLTCKNLMCPMCPSHDHEIQDQAA